MKKVLKLISIPVLSVCILFVFYYYSAQSDDHGPTQPILFSHKIHAGDNQIPCEYCHSYVSESAVPGIPSVKKCMGCHSYVSGRDVDYETDSGKTINIKNEIEKVRRYWEQQKPIPWVKVTSMPDYVHFNHKRHIKKGIECHNCHGDVENMDVVYKAKSLKMGFCLECHEKSADDEYHLTQLRDCLTCHY